MSEPLNAGFQLSPQQRQVWTSQEGAAAQLGLRLEGPLDVGCLKSALQKIVERHEILRTTFQHSSGMKFPFQVVHESTPLCWKEIDATALDASHRNEKLEEAFSAAQNIELKKSPLLHSVLVTLSGEEHVLILSLPLLCADTATLNNLANEVSRFYASGSASGADPLQYADYSEWQNELSQKNDEEARAGKEYWERHDVSQIPALTLPFERKAQRVEFRPAAVQVALNSKALAATGDPASFLLAAWQVLLARMTGQAEIALAYVSDGRSHEELENALGLFAKAVPLVLTLDQDASFAQVVSAVQQLQSQSVEFQDYAPTQGDLPVGFSVEKRFAKQSADGVSISLLRRLCTPIRFHVELRCTVESGVNAELVYDPALFDHAVVESLARRLVILTEAAAASPTAKAMTLPIMDQAEQQQVVTRFNQTAAHYPYERCIHELFEAQAARVPQSPALRCGEQEFSYGELNARANQLAHFLRSRGVKANVPVGLCVERSAEMVVGLLGILKAGGCYVPLIPDNPKARLAHQLSETGAPVVLTEEKFLDRLPPIAEAVCLDRDRAWLADKSSGNPDRLNSPEDLVYVIYTSGSTGVPKGVAVRHFNLVNYSHFICKRLQLEKYPEGLHFATVSTISADLGNTCIFPALISGGCLHVIPYETAMAPNLFASYTAKHPVDVLKITPSHLTSLMNASDGASVLPRKFLVMGGEASSWSFVNRILQSGSCAVMNHYGPTEATVGCCTFLVRDSDVSAWSPATVPIGKPIANDEIYILDEQRQPVPVGVAGELCIGGTGLAKGYLNQPQQTSERFVAHPFSEDSSARLYRTGDLARFLPDGNVEFLGRIDHQVKIRGFRVEPAEIEAVLKRHPAVKQSVILPYEDKSGEKRLAAYVVSAKSPKAEELRGWVAEQLPEYMVPSAFVVLDALPLTANGKVDMKALPSPESQGPAERAMVMPRNPEEEKLIAIWKEVLKLDQISVEDNFFDLGGHSLLATQIIARIRNAFRVQLPLHSFLETPKVSDLAEKILHCPPAESEEEQMARLLQELEGVSDEEAERLLAAEDNVDKSRGAGN